MPHNPRIRLLPDGPYIEIDGGSLYLGRDCLFAVKIPALLNRVVSNRHLRIRAEGPNRWVLEDLGSTNGTWLRGERLGAAVLLRAGDMFTMGRNGPQFAWEAPTLAASDPNATLDEEKASRAETLLDQGDGSAERPFKAGRTPEVTLLHERTGVEHTAQGYTIVIGRDPAAAQIVIRSDEEKHVSGRHAELQFRSDGSVALRDLGSRNGTWVNDRRVRGEVVVKLGYRIVLGLGVTTLTVRALER